MFYYSVYVYTKFSQGCYTSTWAEVWLHDSPSMSADTPRYSEGLMQHCNTSIANAMEILQ